MSDYKPDKWVILECKIGDETHHKVLATWYGGYATGDGWKLNSGIEHVTRHDDKISFWGYSGSVYECFDNEISYGMSMYTSSVLNSWTDKLANSPSGMSMKLLTYEEVRQLYASV
jgi:hypothetical protein